MWLRDRRTNPNCPSSSRSAESCKHNHSASLHSATARCRLLKQRHKNFTLFHNRRSHTIATAAAYLLQTNRFLDREFEFEVNRESTEGLFECSMISCMRVRVCRAINSRRRPPLRELRKRDPLGEASERGRNEASR